MELNWNAIVQHHEQHSIVLLAFCMAKMEKLLTSFSQALRGGMKLRFWCEADCASCGQKACLTKSDRIMKTST